MMTCTKCGKICFATVGPSTSCSTENAVSSCCGAPIATAPDDGQGCRHVNDGGPAFPRQDVTWPENHVHGTQGNPGMSLRDYFAAKAMSGMMMQFVKHGYPENDQAQELKWMVDASWVIADAMLAAREVKS